jgi:cobalt-zinc-cadmium efflux system membrane fusion protein
MRSLLIALGMLACACPTSSAEPRPAADPTEDALDFAKNQGALEYLKVEAVKKETLRPQISLPGKIGFDEDHTQRVAAPMDGRVRALKVKLGDRVAKGAPLIELSSPQVAQLQSDLRKAEEDLAVAKKGSDRAKSLQADGAISGKELSQTEAAFKKAEADVQRVRSQLTVLGIADHANVVATLSAQVAGTVVERNVLAGQEVRADSSQALLSISDLSTVWALAEVYEADLALVDPGDAVEVRVPAYPDDVFKGKVVYVGDVVDPVARTVKVRCAIDNRELKLKPEMFATVKVDAGEEVSAITLPSEAVLVDGETTEVIARAEENQFRVRPVKVGLEVDGRVRIYEGLRDGDIVVTQGALFAREEIRRH